MRWRNGLEAHAAVTIDRAIACGLSTPLANTPASHQGPSRWPKAKMFGAFFAATWCAVPGSAFACALTETCSDAAHCQGEVLAISSDAFGTDVLATSFGDFELVQRVERGQVMADLVTASGSYQVKSDSAAILAQSTSDATTRTLALSAKEAGIVSATLIAPPHRYVDYAAAYEGIRFFTGPCQEAY